MKFGEIIGNDIVKENLVHQIEDGTILHSYMFVGQEGIGKMLIAKEFARQILCHSKNNEGLCQKCESCIKFENNNHPDFKIINPDGNYIKIAQIRQMQEEIYVKPIISKKKVFIIENADSMTEEAQNSLLKTLEEPPEYITIILVLTNQNLLLNTIKSRCMKINFLNLSNEEIKKYIKDNNLIEEPSTSILELCNGSLGKTYKIVENLELYLKTEKLVKDILKPENRTIINLMQQCDFLYKSKEQINYILEYMLILVYDNIMEDCTNQKRYFNIIEALKRAIIKLKSNANYDMCIDELLFSIELN